MSLVSDVYFEVSSTLFQDLGLTLGIVTDQQFFDMLNLTLEDFCKQTGVQLEIFTDTIEAGTSVYDVPDEILRVDDAYLGGVLLEPDPYGTLTRKYKSWRFDQGTPVFWHVDQLPPRKVEILPVPEANGLYIPGANEPDPPHGTFGSFSAIDDSGALQTPDALQDLTLVGPEAPGAVSALTDPIAVVPTDFVAGYIGLGVLARIFGGDNEVKDLARSQWAQQQYQEGCDMLKSIMGERISQ